MSASENQDPVDAVERDGGPSAPTGDLCILVAPYLRTSSNIGLRLPPIPIALTAKMTSKSEESVRYQRQLWRSRKWLRRRGRRNVRMVTTTTTVKTMKTSIPPCRNLSRKASRPQRKPSVRSFEKCAKCSKRFTVVRWSVVCGGHPINFHCEDQIHDDR